MNVHVDGRPCDGRSRSLVRTCCILLSYVPCLIALSLMFGMMYPFIRYFVLDYAGDTLWNAGHPFVFIYSGAGAIFFFSMLLTAYFRSVFTPPLYADPGIWCEPPKVLGKDGVVREARLGFAESHRAKMAANDAVVADALASADGTRTNSSANGMSNVNGSSSTGSSPVVVSPSAVTIPSSNNNIVTDIHPDGSPRFCRRTRLYKPDRSHYCSQCRRVVLAQDHHCPWIGNCVGAGRPPGPEGAGGTGNHKYFLLFLIYIMFSGFHISACVGYAHFFLYKDYSPTSVQQIAHFLVGLCAAVFAGVLGLFATFHVFLVAADETTVSRKIAQLRGSTPSSPTSPAALQQQWWLKRFCIMWCWGESILAAMKPIMGDASPAWQWALPIYAPAWVATSTSTSTSSSTGHHSLVVVDTSATSEEARDHA